MINYADECNSRHQKLLQTQQQTLDEAIVIGGLLTEQKAAVGHGGWMDWVDKHLDFSRTTASSYMDLHKYRDKLQTVCNLTDAYALLKRRKADKSRKKPDDPKQAADPPPNEYAFPYKFKRVTLAMITNKISQLQEANTLGTTNPASIILKSLQYTEKNYE